MNFLKGFSIALVSTSLFLSQNVLAYESESEMMNQERMEKAKIHHDEKKLKKMHRKHHEEMEKMHHEEMKHHNMEKREMDKSAQNEQNNKVASEEPNTTEQTETTQQ